MLEEVNNMKFQEPKKKEVQDPDQRTTRAQGTTTRRITRKATTHQEGISKGR